MRTLLLATSLLSSAAFAGPDKPIIVPALPDWVKPQSMPAIPEKPDEAAIRVLLADQQTRLEPGKIMNYLDVALQIQTPQGLTAGNLSLPWNPETDELTVHKLIIHREGKEIDILAGGQTFTVVRREPNLESATLDGVLTANIQPEGLQVGDVLEYAATITKSDPVLGGHVEQTGASWNGVPFIRTHMSVEWPASLPVILRQIGALPPVKAVKAGNMMRAELAMDNVQPIIPPRQAPSRYAVGRVIEFSDFKSWADLGTLMAPLYQKAALIPAEGPLRTELEKIKAASTDPVKRAEAALTLVQDRVRYVALLMGSGGLTPAKAEETWARRYGDCKAKTALLLALLHELGIEADPVAANIFLGDGIDQRLPMVGLFNHVLVRAKVNGRDYWLDGTRSGDTSLARLQTPDFGWGLPLVAKNAALVRMAPLPLTEPDYDLAIDFDARNGLTLPAPVKAQVTLRGDQAIGTRLALANLDAAARDNVLREYFKQRLDDVEISKVSASFDPVTATESFVMEGTVKMDWTDGQYWTDWTRVGYEADFSRTGSANPDAPFAIDFPSYDRTVETIQLPPGFTAQNIFRRDPIDETVGGVEYRRTSSIKDNIFRIERTTRAVAPEFAAKDAPAAAKRLKELYDLPVSVRRPGNYQMTTAEVNEELKTTPKDAAGFIRRGWLLFGQKNYSGARIALGDALKLEPGDERAQAGILSTFAAEQDWKGAKAYASGIDLSKVRTADLANALANFADSQGDRSEALAAYDRALQIKPDELYILWNRARVHAAAGDFERAMADYESAINRDPKQFNLYVNLADLQRQAGHPEAALATARRAIAAANPSQGNGYTTAAVIYGQLGRNADEMKAYEQSLAIDAAPAVYLMRSGARPRSDIAAREADIDQALKQEPRNDAALIAKAQLRLEQGNYVSAIDTYSAILGRDPKSISALNLRGIAYARAGQADKAEVDFRSAKALADNAGLLNNICYEKAMAGVALDLALTECDASLAKDPTASGTIDSRAFVLLRMGRAAEAITEYDKVLAKNPRIAASLYGRAIAWSKQGDEAKAQADRKAALVIDPQIERRFIVYGVTMQPATPKN